MIIQLNHAAKGLIVRAMQTFNDDFFFKLQKLRWEFA